MCDIRLQLSDLSDFDVSGRCAMPRQVELGENISGAPRSGSAPISPEGPNVSNLHLIRDTPLTSEQNVRWRAFVDAEPNWALLHEMDVERFAAFAVSAWPLTLNEIETLLRSSIVDEHLRVDVATTLLLTCFDEIS